MQRRDRTLPLELDLGGELHVVAMDLDQKRDDQRNDENDDPRALDELRHHLDH